LCPGEGVFSGIPRLAKLIQADAGNSVRSLAGRLSRVTAFAVSDAKKRLHNPGCVRLHL
jgi:hypothetical protein